MQINFVIHITRMIKVYSNSKVMIGEKLKRWEGKILQYLATGITFQFSQNFI